MNHYQRFWLHSRQSTNRIARMFDRDKGIAKWSFAIPNEQAIATIAAAGPVLEVMAGSGYWSRLVADQFAQQGLPHDVLAVDNQSWPNDGSHKVEFGKYHPVLNGDAVEHAAKESARSLLMVWPYMDDTAELVLRAYKGPIVFLVTEGEGGCCGTEGMFRALSEVYEHVEDINIPQWDCIHDYLTVWRRPVAG